VRVVEVARQADAFLSLRGVAAAGARLRLGFKVPGVMARVSVVEGQHVTKGQVLATLSSAQEGAHLRAARATLQGAQRDAARAQELEWKSAGPRAMREDAMTRLDVAEANVEVAKNGLSLTELRAPVAGVVFQRIAEPGEAVVPGAPVLLVDETDRTLINVGVTEQELSRVRVGNTAEVVVKVSGATLQAKVVSIAPAPGSADGLYKVQLRPGEADEARIKPGALVEVHLSVLAGASDIHVPLEAVVHRRDKDWVLRVEGQAKETVARLQLVTVGRSAGRGVYVTSGLQGGERIVAEGAFFLEDGRAVRVVE
jgi:membrane fusion protein (multidrug efflux system)